MGQPKIIKKNLFVVIEWHSITGSGESRAKEVTPALHQDFLIYSFEDDMSQFFKYFLVFFGPTSQESFSWYGPFRGIELPGVPRPAPAEVNVHPG